MSAKEVTPTQLNAVCAELQAGCSYQTACKRVGVNVSALRWQRYGDPAVMRRCARARAAGLVKRAAWLREKAAKLEREAERITGRPKNYEIV